MSSVLAEILAAKRRRLAAGERAPAGTPALPPDGRRFVRALRKGGVIAEIKHRSPSAGVLLPDAARRIESVACAYRRGGAAALSVVVEQDFFAGDPAWIPRAKAATGLPVLMKDFIVDEAQLDVATSLGADAVLLIVAALPDAELARLHQAARARGLAVLVEAHDEAEIGRALRVAPEILGVNARDLSSFAVNLGAVEALGGRIPEGVLGVAESGVRTTQDLVSLGAAGYGAFLVGETLLKSDDPAKALRYLRGRGTTEVKICGVTREEDVDTCLENGVDWIGLVFAPGSPRRVTEERGRRLRTRAKGEGGARQGGDGSRDHPSGAVKGVVAVFGEETPKAEFERIVECVRPDVVQMPLPALSPFERPFSPDIALWSTVRVGRDDLLSAVEGPGDALHFDTAEGGLGGGTGRTFDWNVLASLRLRRPFVVAGGLTPANVASAIRAVSPFAVDVASGVESSPGVKDPSKIAAFVEEAGRA